MRDVAVYEIVVFSESWPDPDQQSDDYDKVVDTMDECVQIAAGALEARLNEWLNVGKVKVMVKE